MSMTRNKLMLALVVGAGLIVGGCLESKTVVTVEKDGSGTVEQTVYYPEMNLGGAGFQFGADGENSTGFEFGNAAKKPTAEEELAATRAKAEKAAASMGDGVTLQSVDALPPRDGRKGVRIVYAFKDINKLRLNPMPDVQLGGGMQIGNTPGQDLGGGEFAAGGQAGELPGPPAPKENETIRFAFTPSPKPKLTIYTPDVTPPPSGGPGDTDDPQAKAMAAMMMKQMFDGMVLEMRVQLKGRLTETNATYAGRKTSAIGLYKLDFDKLVDDQAAMEKLLSLESATDAETAKKQLQDPALAKYLKLEMKEQVEVSFE
jgi:hypothetical protein